MFRKTCYFADFDKKIENIGDIKCFVNFDK